MRAGRRRGPLGLDEFVVDAEQLEGVDGADHQIVVGVLAVVEVEAAEAPLVEQEGDDVLDVGAVGVVPHVDQHLGLGAELEAERVGDAPVGQIGVVEAGLEELVLDQHPGALGKRFVDRGQPLEKGLFAATNVVLTGVVGAVCKPQAEVVRAGRLHDLDALEQVLQSLPADLGVGVAERAEPIVLVLKDVGVDGAEANAALFGVAAQSVVVVGLVPGNVERHAGGGAGEPVDRGGVVELLEDGAGSAGPGKGLEAGAGVAVAP